MKKIFLLFTLVGLFTFSGCSDMLDTDPTNKVSGTAIFSDAQNSLSAINGMYRLMYTGGWGGGWEAENGGLPAFNLVFDLMGEDHVMDGSGSGWYWYDYGFDTWGDYTHTSGHQYHMWNFFYTLLANANYIIAQEGNIPGDENIANYVVGQAYAIRSFAYMYLVQSYSQSGDPSKPGVPLYFEPTIAGSVGNGRGTVQQVYDQANDDIDKAITLLEASSQTQMHKSHIDKYVAYGLKARHAMVQKDYPTALTYAGKAMESPSTVAPFSDVRHVNDISKRNVLWGLGIQTDQAIGNWSIYAHMDADSKGTYSKARHLISSWLYNNIPNTDLRKNWWTEPIPESMWGEPGSTNGSYRSWCQTKLVYLDVSASTGDYILMREEEMVLIAAEAACHLERFPEARQYISMLGTERDTDYSTRVASFTDSKIYNTNTNGSLETLMDEILFQRRVELWSEVPRVHDLQRLGLGYDRDYPSTNHTILLSSKNTDAYSPAFILWIPQKEFDGNENMDATTDQNPKQY
ncbi:MAG: RagB/SusD family nutrient uptake outer membrane protein [Bacteroidales bacterium]